MPVETSIVIRTLNEARHLESLMQGIHGQNYQDWEIVLVDSGSIDGTLAIAEKYGARIFHIPQEEFTFGRSLNMGCEAAEGRYLVFASGHVRPITNSWLSNMVKPFQEPAVAMVYGRQRGTDANRLSEIQDLHANYGISSSIQVDQPKGNNGNAAIRRDLWRSKPFDELLPGLEDLEWAKHVQRLGFRVYYAADAGVHHVHEESLKQVFRRYQRESIAYKQLFPAFQFTWAGGAMGLANHTIRDVLFAIREKKKRKLYQVPGTRVAQLLGTHSGVHYQRRLGRNITRHLKVPETYERVVIDGPGRHQLTAGDVPEPGRGEVLVQVAYAGVCPWDPGFAKGEPAGAVRFPTVPGHEFSGVVVKAGPEVKGFPNGQKVAGESKALGVHCPVCDDFKEISGHPDQDEHLGSLTAAPMAAGPGGVYATHIVRPSRSLHKLPLGLGLKYGSMVESVATCLQAIKSLGAAAGGSACVIGAGPLGNLCAQILKSSSLTVTAIDSSDYRLALLQMYDVNTLKELPSLDRYDHVFYAGGNGQMAPDLALPRVLEQLTNYAGITVLGCPHLPIARAKDAQVIPNNQIRCNSAGSPSGGDSRRYWQQAIRLASSGSVNLEEHTAVVRPLEAYQQAWKELDCGASFNMLLGTSKELAAL